MGDATVPTPQEGLNTMEQPTLTKDNGEVVPLELGCVFAGHRGHYIQQSIIRLALELGWVNPDAEKAANEYDDNYSDLEWEFFDVWHDMADEATTYLNDHTTGAHWDWWDGEFHLQTMDWWDADDFFYGG